MEKEAMMDSKTPVDSQPSTGTVIAAVFLAIPSILWYTFTIVFFGFLLLALWFNHQNLEAFTHEVLLWVQRILMLSGLLLAATIVYRGYKVYHSIKMDLYERLNAKSVSERQMLLVEKQRLQNKQLAIRNSIEQQLPVLMKYAMEAGHNISWDGRGLKVENYLSNVHNIASPVSAQIGAPGPDTYVPEPYTFSDILANWEPTKDGILLAKKRDMLTVPIGEDLCHTAFTGSTDAGKTNDERMLLIQLLYLQQICFLCDRNYAPMRADKKTGATYDYRPIEAQLRYPAIHESKEAVALLDHLIGELDTRRLQRRKAGNAGYVIHFEDMYLFMDELPAFCQERPEIMQYVGRLVREARQYGIFFVGAAQDLLNATLKNDNGAIRDNLLTNFYGGGDMHTARLVLNLQRGETIDETGLGVKGVKYLRAKGAGIEHEKVRTPYADNDATLLLLSEMPPRIQLDRLMGPTGKVVDSGSEPVTDLPKSDTDLTGDLKRVYEAFCTLDDEGKRTSARGVEQITGIDKDKAKNLLNQLQAMGYINRGKKSV
jgi:hypothetical protein